MGTKEFNVVDNIISWLRLARVLPYIHSNDSVLDFGCGNQAYLLHHIEGKIKDGIGIDYDVDSQEISSKIRTQKFRFTSQLPNPDNSFNI